MRTPHVFLLYGFSAGKNMGNMARNSKLLYQSLIYFDLLGDDKNLNRYSLAKNMLHINSMLVRIGCGTVKDSRSFRVSDLFNATSCGKRQYALVSSTKLTIDKTKNTMDIAKKI
jgi:hypothetical protein